MSPRIIFMVTAASGVVLLLVGMGLLIRSLLRERRAKMVLDDQGKAIRLPLAPLQKRALLSLAIGVVMSAAIVAVFLVKGTVSLSEEKGMRLLVTALFLGGIGSYLILLLRTSGKGGSTALDERDQRILTQAPAVQVMAMLIALAAWAITLTEVYWDEGAIPIDYPYLVFLSVFIVNMLAAAFGILLGYWRM